MRSYNYLYIIIALFLLQGCATLPLDTFNKKAAAFELSYNEALKTVTLWEAEGRLVGKPLKDMQDRVTQIKIARTAMYLARGSGDLSTATGQLATANTALSLVRSHIVAQEKANE